nr:PREDICTED: probable cyclin-dependent kinase 9 [Bemisia tabaci]
MPFNSDEPKPSFQPSNKVKVMSKPMPPPSRGGSYMGQPRSGGTSGMEGSMSVNSIMTTKEKQKYIEDYNFQYCDEASKYEKIAKIGQGTFGEVFKAKDRKTQKKIVAMKKVLMDNEKEGVSNDLRPNYSVL